MLQIKDIDQLAPADRLIVALDVNTEDEARAIVVCLGDLVGFYKVGLQLFFRTGFGFNFVKELMKKWEKRVFVDLKLEDIPTTIQLAIQDNPEIDLVEFMTLRGVSSMLNAAKTSNGKNKTRFLMLTVLSSLDDTDMVDLYGKEVTVQKIVGLITRKAIAAGYDGVIASGDSVRQLRKEFGDDLLIVAPGIRPSGFSDDDHKRTLTPYKAIIDGANFLVVGRPITAADDPEKAALSIIKEMEMGFAERKRLEESHPDHKEDFDSMLQTAARAK